MSGYLPLHEATSASNWENVRDLAEIGGADLNARTRGPLQETALHIAAANSDVTTLTELLKAGQC